MAVNYVSQDQFGILVDDIKYVSATEFHHVSAYNVYRNGKKIGTTDNTSTTNCTYTDNVATAGAYDYQISVVADEEYGLSNTAHIDFVPTAINNASADNTAVSGIYLPNGMKTNKLQPGVNIVRMSDGTTKKVAGK